MEVTQASLEQEVSDTWRGPVSGDGEEPTCRTKNRRQKGLTWPLPSEVAGLLQTLFDVADQDLVLSLIPSVVPAPALPRLLTHCDHGLWHPPGLSAETRVATPASTCPGASPVWRSGRRRAERAADLTADSSRSSTTM